MTDPYDPQTYALWLLDVLQDKERNKKLLGVEEVIRNPSMLLALDRNGEVVSPTGDGTWPLLVNNDLDLVMGATVIFTGSEMRSRKLADWHYQCIPNKGPFNTTIWSQPYDGGICLQFLSWNHEWYKYRDVLSLVHLRLCDYDPVKSDDWSRVPVYPMDDWEWGPYRQIFPFHKGDWGNDWLSPREMAERRAVTFYLCNPKLSKDVRKLICRWCMCPPYPKRLIISYCESSNEYFPPRKDIVRRPRKRVKRK